MDNQKDYGKYVARRAARSPVLKNCAAAFWVGGLICLCGQLLMILYRRVGVPLELVSTLTSVTLVFVAVFLTALGVFDRIARYAGAGTLVPITGFANAVVSPAIDFKSEGFITGMAAKMFAVAGPVIVFGTLASVLYGVVLMLL